MSASNQSLIAAKLAEAEALLRTSQPDNIRQGATLLGDALTLLRADSSSDPRRAASVAYRQGRVLETLGSPDDRDAALRAYDAAIEMLRHLSEPDDTTQRDLAVAWMNRGNVLQKRGQTSDLRQAIEAYDETIRIFETLSYATNSEWRNSLAAAWMNRGGAWRRLKDGDRDRETLRSFDAAIALARKLPLDDKPAFRVNLAAAWMNRANALLRDGTGADAAQAREAAREALPIIKPIEDTMPSGAEVSLRTRHVLCRAIATLLTDQSTPPSSRQGLFDEATDAVDEGMQLARAWEQRGFHPIRPLVAELFRFGAALYISHQPHFLAEYLLENLDRERTPDAMSGNAAMHTTAEAVLQDALQAYEGTRHVTLDMPGVERHLETLSELRTAAARLAELRPPKTRGNPSDSG